MKKEIKKSINVSFKNASLEVDGDRIVVVEKDKDGYVINEINLLDAISFLVDEDGLDITFKKSDIIE